MIDPLFQRILVRECRRRRIPIIFDEVFSGCWRLGAEVCALSCPHLDPLQFLWSKDAVIVVRGIIFAHINNLCRGLFNSVKFMQWFKEFFSYTALYWYCQSATDLLGCTPDIACYSKLLTGGLVPLAATLATQPIFEAFRGISKVTLNSLETSSC